MDDDYPKAKRKTRTDLIAEIKMLADMNRDLLHVCEKWKRLALFRERALAALKASRS